LLRGHCRPRLLELDAIRNAVSDRQVTRSNSAHLCGIGNRADHLCWGQTLVEGDQTCIVSGRPTESLEPLTVEMRRRLSADIHRAAAFGCRSYTGGVDKRPGRNPNRMTLVHPFLPALRSPPCSLSISSSNSPYLLMINSIIFDPVFPALPETLLPIDRKVAETARCLGRI